MVRFETDLETITAQVTAFKDTWPSRAAERTAQFTAAGKFNDAAPIWSEIKPVFVALQHLKCAYCERPMAGDTFGSGEYDLEHYRPKGRVQAWPYKFSTGEANAHGYYWLAYDLGNYAVACKSCNSGLKLDRFPVAGTRGSTVADVNALNESEQPLLIFPIGAGDENPRDLIGFIGAVPYTKLKRGRRNRRARVTIDFFHLADPKREELFRDRFELIRNLWGQIKLANDSNASSEEQQDAKLMLEVLCSARSPHSSCAAAFVELYTQNPLKAFEIAKEAAKYLSAGRDQRISWL